MNKSLKKILSLLVLTAVLFCSVTAAAPEKGLSLAMTVYASPVSGKCGVLTWKLDDNGLLDISGEGAIPDYNEGDAPWYKYRNSIKSVWLRSGVTTVGRYAFSGCSELSYTTFATSVKDFHNYCFKGCTKLSGINVFNIKTWAGINFSSAICHPFYASSGGNFYLVGNPQTILDFPAGLEKVTRFSFYRMTGITQVNIPHGVKKIEFGAFQGCSKLKTVSIPRSVTTIEDYAFNNCSSLSTVIYGGDKSGWNAISISSTADGNAKLISAAKRFAKSGYCGDNL